MSDQKAPNIQIPVDLTNPGQFFACCGLLELADRLWPGAEGWFDTGGTAFNIVCKGGFGDLCSSITNCDMQPLMSATDLEELRRLSRPHWELEANIDQLKKKKRVTLAHLKDLKSRRKSCEKEEKKALQPEIDELSETKKALEAELRPLREQLEANKSTTIVLSREMDKRKELLNSRRIASGFRLGPPFGIRIDWWMVENCDADHLKTWAGQQAIMSIAIAIQAALIPLKNTLLLEHEALIIKDSEAIAPLSFDSGRVGTAQDIGYSADKIGQPISCCVWTEFLTLIALQRFGLRPDAADYFTYSVWHKPLPPSIAACAVRGLFPQLVGCEGRFRLAGRDSGNRYKAFQQATLTEWRQ